MPILQLSRHKHLYINSNFGTPDAQAHIAYDMQRYIVFIETTAVTI